MNLSSENAQTIVEELAKKMEDKGLIIKSKYYKGSSSYAILKSGTSVGYRKNSRSGKSGVVFYCSKDRTDKLNLTRKLNIETLTSWEKHLLEDVEKAINKYEN